jgi:hypothetical protein
MNDIIEQNKQDIISILKDAKGEPISPNVIATRMGGYIGLASIKMLCANLTDEGRIRRGGERKPTYYVPSDAQQRVEAAARSYSFKTLRPRKDHLEALERAKMARESIKSIG